ncbi:MAG TPA: glycine cleavage system protein GcvH [Chloroflexota bacterium]|nr:glycine cleavage system protein GcvH [Chloroflexota bacterium]
MAGSFPDDRRYTESDEWVQTQGDIVVIGITSFAAEQLGDIVFLELPDVGATFGEGDSFGEIESVKSVSALYSPLSGEIVEVNEELGDNPGIVNEDPFGAGWIVKLRPEDSSALEGLLDATAYAQSAAERG